MTARPPWTASGWERARRCPGSCLLPHSELTTKEAELGRAIHRYLELVPVMGPERALQDREIPERYRDAVALIDWVPAALGAEVAFAVAPLTGEARELGRGLARDYSGCAADEVPGTADIVGVTADAVYVGDYKLGRKGRSAFEMYQLRFLGFAAARTYGRSKAIVDNIDVIPGLAPVRDRAILDEWELYAIEAELAETWQAVHAQGAAERLHEGEWCRYCPAWGYCPLKRQLLVAIGSGKPLESYDNLATELTEETAAAAWAACDRIESAVARVRARVQELAVQRGEHGLRLANGRVLREVIEEGQAKLDAEVVREVVTELYGSDVAEAALPPAATQTAIKAALKAVSDQDSPTARMKRVMSETAKRGGIHRDPVVRVKECNS